MTNLVSIHDGKVTASSLTVAEHFNKQHSVVMRSIRNIECSEEFNRCNFALVNYTDAKGQQRPCYCITRDGFMFLVMGFTGKEAAMWKERFINAFNEMEEKLRQQQMNQPIIEHLRGKTLKMNVGYDGQLSFHVEDPADFWKKAANAIKDPMNIGIKEETILMLANACMEALAHRADIRKNNSLKGGAR